MATAAGPRDRWLWIFLWWGLVSLGIMRDGRRGGEEWRSGRGTAAVFLIGRKCLTRSSVTILEVRDTWIKNTFCLHQRAMGSLSEQWGPT